MTARITLTLTLFATLVGTLVSTASGQQQTGQIVKVIPNPKATGKSYQLQYKLKPGEKIRVKVVQLVSSENKIEGTAQRAQSRSVSVKRWDVIGTTCRFRFWISIFTLTRNWQRDDRVQHFAGWQGHPIGRGVRWPRLRRHFVA